VEELELLDELVELELVVLDDVVVVELVVTVAS